MNIHQHQLSYTLYVISYPNVSADNGPAAGSIPAAAADAITATSTYSYAHDYTAFTPTNADEYTRYIL